jgi:hypothetical protein
MGLLFAIRGSEQKFDAERVVTLAKNVGAKWDYLTLKSLCWPSARVNRRLNTKDWKAPNWVLVEVTDSANFAHTP